MKSLVFILLSVFFVVAPIKFISACETSASEAGDGSDKTIRKRVRESTNDNQISNDRSAIQLKKRKIEEEEKEELSEMIDGDKLLDYLAKQESRFDNLLDDTKDAIKFYVLGEDEKSILEARRELLRIAKDESHQNQYDAAVVLFESRVIKEHKQGLSLLIDIVQNNKNLNQYDAAEFLFFLKEEQYKKIALKNLRVIADKLIKKKNPPLYFRLIYYLLKSENTDDHKISKTLFDKYSEKYENVAKAYVKNAYKLITGCWWNPNQQSQRTYILSYGGKNIEDEKIGNIILKWAIQSTNYPYQFLAAKWLYNSCEKSIWRESLNIHSDSSMTTLLLSGPAVCLGTGMVRLSYGIYDYFFPHAGIQALQKIAEDNNHPNQSEAKEILKNAPRPPGSHVIRM